MAQIDSSAKDFKHLRISEDLKGRKLLEDAKFHEKDYGLNYPNDGKTYQKKILGLALFGLGQIGTMHFHNLIKMVDVDLLYVVEYDQSRLNYVSFKFNLKAKLLTSDNADEVFNDPKVDVVVICTPTGTHEGLVTQALKAGKAVFCEKPLALSTDGVVSEVKPGEEKPLSYNHAGIKNCYDLAKKAGKPLFCAFNRRFDPALAEIKQRVDNGEIGDIHVVKSCARDSPKPRVENLKTSGGIFHDCIVHDIDLICWVMGSYPTTVSSVAHSFDPKIAEIDDYDTVAITMKFPSGALGVIDISRYSIYGYDQRLEVFGNKGMFTSEAIRPTSVQFHNEIGSRKNPICYSFASRYPDSYHFEMEHFLEEVKGNRKSMNSGENVLAVSKIASSCERSAKEGRIIHISWD